MSWEVQIYNPSEMLKASEIEHFIEDLEEPENIDFTLITQLIEERKMTCKIFDLLFKIDSYLKVGISFEIFL